MLVLALMATGCKARKPAPVVDAAPVRLDAAKPKEPAGGIAVGWSEGAGARVATLATWDGTDWMPAGGDCPTTLAVLDGSRMVGAEHRVKDCRIDYQSEDDESFVATWGLAPGPGSYIDGTGETRRRLQTLAVAALAEEDEAVTPEQFDMDFEVFPLEVGGRQFAVVEAALRPGQGCDSPACAASACGIVSRGAVLLYETGDGDPRELHRELRLEEPATLQLVDFVVPSPGASMALVLAERNCDGRSYALVASDGNELARRDAVNRPDAKTD